MKILVVGGAGYLGGGLTDLLLQSGNEFRVYDYLLYEESYRKDVPFVFGDIRDYARLQPQLDWADCVVWLAAIVGDPACALNEQLTNEINKTALEYLVANFKKRIIYMSSCSVYGAGDDVLKEESQKNPLSLYARGKLEAEEILAGTNSICFRLGTLFGLSDRFSRIRFDLVVNTLVMRAILHGKISVFGGEQYRPLLHVRDVGAAVMLALQKDNIGIYNLHWENYKISDIGDRVQEYFPWISVEKTGSVFQDNRNYKVSSDKARNELGFNPVITLDQGIREMKELLEQKRIKDTFISRYSNFEYLKPLIEEHHSPLGKELKMNV